MTAKEIIKQAKDAGYDRSAYASNTGIDTTNTTYFGNSQMTAEELYAKANATGRMLARQTGFLRAGKVHATKSRAELLAACRATLAEMTALSREISPRNADGYTDPNDPFTVDCLLLWRREIGLLEQGVNKTPL